MLQLKPLDESVPIFQQLGTDVSPVVLVNVFQVAKEDIPTLFCGVRQVRPAVGARLARS